MIALRPKKTAKEESRTKQLASWIHRVRRKRLMRCKSRKRDLRVEAVLTYALYKAQYELRDKQLARIKRWQQLKRKLSDSPERKDAIKNDCQVENETEQWPQELTAELNSLDDFMLQLGQVKTPLQR